MVERKSKTALYFILFILPCLVLYLLFFIWPFIRGIGISMTNWDGLTPKTPIIMEKEEFEDKILNKLKKQSDIDYLMKIYTYEESDNSYHRLSVSGLTRIKIQRVVKKAGYEPENYKFVGLDNYKKVFTGKVDKDFYPHFYDQKKYNKNSSLPTTIEKKQFENEILKKASAEDAQYFKDCYSYNADKKTYVLSQDYDDFYITDPLYNLSEVADGSVDYSAVEKLIKNVNKALLEGDVSTAQSLKSAFLKDNTLSAASEKAVETAFSGLSKTTALKVKLANTWILRKLNMGVTGFTLFFAVFSVIGINVIAFLLALALDTGIHGQKIFRSIFFLPNVLSMIIVSLIWSLLFIQLLPAITGIKQWLGDPAKTPWLLVFVATWQGCGYYMIVYLAGLQNIPTDIIEAAKIDGASGWQRFQHITMPMMVPAITISLFLSIANALKSFDLIYAMIGSTGYATGTVPFVMDIYFDAFAQKQAGMATAKAMVLFVVIFIITGIQLYTMKKKEIEQ